MEGGVGSELLVPGQEDGGDVVEGESDDVVPLSGGGGVSRPVLPHISFPRSLRQASQSRVSSLAFYLNSQQDRLALGLAFFLYH
jgi:hypothetical protein